MPNSGQGEVTLILDFNEIMILLLQIFLSLTIWVPYQVHATHYVTQVKEEVSNQLLLSGGKAVGDCDAILVSSTGELDSQHCYSASKYLINLSILFLDFPLQTRAIEKY